MVAVVAGPSKTTGSLMNVAALASSVLADTEQSLIEYTQVVRNEPVVIVEDSLVPLDVTPNICRTLTNLFMAYYLQAVSISNHVGNASVMSTLDKFSTKRSLVNAAGQFIEKAMERFDTHINRPRNHMLTRQTHNYSAESASLLYPTIFRPSAESYQTSNEAIDDIVAGVTHVAKNVYQDAINPSQDKGPVDINRKDEVMADVLNASLKSVNEAPNLAIGKLFNVTIVNNQSSAVIPTSVRLSPLDISKGLMLKILAQGDLKNTWKERWNRWKQGELNFFGDLILANDLVKYRRQLIASDKHGIFREIEKQRRNNKLAGVLTGNVSIAAASSMAIVSEDTMQDLHYMIGGSYENRRIRDEIFARCSLMFLVVVDPSLQYAKIYHRSIELPMELTFSEFGRFGKGDGPDVMAMLQAFQAGQRPNI